MRLGIWPSTGRPWNEILELARHCEATGWDSVYLADHFMPHGDLSEHADATAPLDGDRLDCWSVLAALAAAVPRVRLGTLVSSVTFRHPAVLANIAAAIDNISGGRLILGIGAGWQLNEHQSYGIPLGTLTERFDRFEEACAVISSMLREKRTTFHGRYYDVTDAPNQPVPLQARLPVLIGGGGEKRTLPIAARFADEWNYWSSPDVLAQKVRVLHRHCDTIGRDASEIQVSTQPYSRTITGTPSEIADTLGQFGEAGADELILPDVMQPLAEFKDACDLVMANAVR
jgi:F420-dependent oxidoreductase-like protein